MVSLTNQLNMFWFDLMHSPSQGKVLLSVFGCAVALLALFNSIRRWIRRRSPGYFEPEIGYSDLHGDEETIEADAKSSLAAKSGWKPVQSSVPSFVRTLLVIGFVFTLSLWYGLRNYLIIHYWQAGEYSVSVQNYPEAVRIYRKAEGIDPAVRSTHVQLGKALMRNNQIDQGIRELSLAANADHADASIHVLLGDVLLAQEHPEDAAKQFQQAIAIAPKDANNYVRLGSCFAQLKRVDDAIKEFRYAVSISGADVKANANLGSYLIGNGDPQEGIKYLKRSIDLSPADIAAHNTLASAYAQMGMYREAAAEFRAELAIDPEYGFGYFNLGSALKDAGDLRGAAEAYKSYLRKAPTHPSFAVGVPLAVKQLNELNRRIGHGQ